MKENFEIAAIKKHITYKQKILIPTFIIKTINEIENSYAFEEDVYCENSKIGKIIKKTKLEFVFRRKKSYETDTIFPKEPCNYLTVIKKEQKINEKDILNIKEVIYQIIDLYEKMINADIDDYLQYIQGRNLGVKCAKCQFLIICKTEKRKAMYLNCEDRFLNYIIQTKKHKPFDVEYVMISVLKKVQLLKNIRKSKQILGLNHEEYENKRMFITKEYLENYEGEEINEH